MTPNIELVLLLRPRTIRVDAALDLGDALMVTMNHADDGNRAAHKNRYDRDQKRSQSDDSIQQSFHLHLPYGQGPSAHDTILVELTGIEPVASWLQTRRSPS